ncbi:hypothetical protein L6164_033380 [Bauhinia variegata]|uniref:Uncharacterized protein n=1 Tax=Bauhinia variegata TaxID=167791 RepID=A0ACB9KRH3_BAUVA|nr:hypothetical protein L6164_033380 [Bauhinia variegata]
MIEKKRPLAHEEKEAMEEEEVQITLTMKNQLNNHKIQEVGEIMAIGEEEDESMTSLILNVIIVTNMVIMPMNGWALKTIKEKHFLLRKKEMKNNSCYWPKR